MAIGIWTDQGAVITTISGNHYESTTVLYDTNPIILSPNADGKIFKWWGSSNGPTFGVYYAESADGTTWTPYVSNPLLSFATQNETKVFKNPNDNKYYLFTSSIGAPHGPIAVYTATDGVTYTLQNANAIPEGAGGSPDSSWAGQLSIVDIIAGTWYGYYAGFNNTVYVMIQATSTDGINWTKNYGNQITQGGPSNFIFKKIGGTYYGWSQIMIHGIPAFGIGLPSDITRFSSPSAVGPWTPLSNVGTTFYRTQSGEGIGTNVGQVADPTGMIELNGNVYMFFTAKSRGDLGSNGTINLAVASGTTLAQIIGTIEGVVNIPAPWGSGTPTQFITQATDNFTRANANPIGGNWSTLSASGGFTSCQIVSNKAEASAATTVRGGSWWNARTWENDQWDSATISANNTAIGNQTGVILRGSITGAATTYMVFATSVPPLTIKLDKIVAGVYTAGVLSVAYTWALNDALTAAVFGNTISIYDNGNLILTGIDASIASGAPGIHLFAASTLADAALSAWSGGNIINPAPIPNPGISGSSYLIGSGNRWCTHGLGSGAIF